MAVYGMSNRYPHCHDVVRPQTAEYRFTEGYYPTEAYTANAAPYTTHSDWDNNGLSSIPRPTTAPNPNHHEFNTNRPHHYDQYGLSQGYTIFVP